MENFPLEKGLNGRDDILRNNILLQSRDNDIIDIKAYQNHDHSISNRACKIPQTKLSINTSL